MCIRNHHTTLAPSTQSELFCATTYKNVLNFASRAHVQQLTPGGAPYMVHVHSVAMEVILSLHAEPLSCGDATLAVCCALLHDTIEDTAVTSTDLHVYGAATVLGVEALTKDKTLAKAPAMQDSLARLKQQPYAVQRVKLADRICNLDRPPAHWDADKCRRYKQEGQMILDALQEACPYLAARLADKIAHYDRFIEEIK